MNEQLALHSRLTLRALTDRQLVNVLTTLAALERAAIAKLVAALSEFDKRRLYLPLGFNSLFAYCTNRLSLSQDEAFYRIEAARVARRFPVVLDYLEKGAMTLTTVRLLGPHLTVDNHKQLFETACHLTRPQVAVLIARLRPKPDVPSTIRKLPRALSQMATPGAAALGTPAAAAMGTLAVAAVGVPGAAAMVPPATPAAELSAPAALTPVAQDAGGLVPTVGAVPTPRPSGAPSGPDVAPSTCPADAGVLLVPAEIPSRRPVIEPLSATRYRLQITISDRSHDTLREIQTLIRHVIPTGDPAAIVERALALLLADLKKRRAAEVRHPRAGRAEPPRGRHIPARVVRAVWKRDESQCAFVAPNGHRCRAEDFLELHHVVPFARGGKPTVGNIQLRCRAHNAHEAELAFGARTRR